MIPGYTPCIIAEAGVNHNGSIEIAKQLIDVAAESGADVVKFQTFKAEKMISCHAQKADYQTQTTPEAESHLDMVKNLELDENAHHELLKYCRLRNIEFLSTPFDIESIDFLTQTLNLARLKIPSGEITNGPYLLHIAKTGKPVILSTGMSTMGEIEAALSVLAFGYLNMEDFPSEETLQNAFFSESGQRLLKENVILLHCTTEYPAAFEDVNLRVMETMRKSFGLPIGLSDHTQGIAIPIAAVALGAAVIEKHFTLNRDFSGPDHRASIEPDELKTMVQYIRQTTKAMGDGKKIPAPSEIRNRSIVRKSIIASRAISEGELLEENNMTAKRPGDGVSPMCYWSLLGKKVRRAYSEDEKISEH